MGSDSCPSVIPEGGVSVPVSHGRGRGQEAEVTLRDLPMGHSGHSASCSHLQVELTPAPAREGPSLKPQPGALLGLAVPSPLVSQGRHAW